MSRVGANIAANIAGQAWAVVLSLACTPFYIAFLGVEAYGLIAFFLVVQTFLQLLDFGLAATINREVARAGGESRPQLANLLASAQALYWLVGLAVAGVLFLTLPAATGWWVNPHRLAAADLAAAAQAFSLVVLVQWPISFYASAINGSQMQVALNAIQIPFATLSSVGGVLLLWLGPRSVAALLLWQGLVAAALLTVLHGHFHAKLGHLLSAGRRSLTAFHGIWRFSLGMSGISFTGVALTHLDKIILSKLLSLEVLGYYSLATTAARALYVLITPVFSAYYPRLSMLAKRGDPGAVQRAYHVASQVMAVLIVPLATVIGMFPVELLALWLRDLAIAHTVAPLASLLVLGTCLNGLMNVPFALQLAYGNTRIGLSINALLVALLVPSLLFAASRYGAIGAAAMWAVCNALYLLVGIPLTHHALLDGGVREWAWNDLLPPLIVALGVAAAARWLMPAPLSGPSAIAALALVWILATLAAMMTSSAMRAWAVQALSPRSL